MWDSLYIIQLKLFKVDARIHVVITTDRCTIYTMKIKTFKHITSYRHRPSWSLSYTALNGGGLSRAISSDFAAHIDTLRHVHTHIIYVLLVAFV